MSNLTMWDDGRTEHGYGDHGIILNGGEGCILSVCKAENGGFTFTEECDGCFQHTYTKEEALLLIEELKSWILS